MGTAGGDDKREGRSAPEHRERRPAAASKTRRTQEQRRRETQSSVVAAAVEVLLDQGYHNLTIAKVAEKAGVSRGAQFNYFRTKHQLLTAAARHFLSEAVVKASAAAATARRRPDPMAVFVASSERFFLGRDYAAMQELVLAARTDAVLAAAYNPMVKETREIIDRIWIDVLREANYTNPAAIVSHTNNLMRGLAWEAIAYGECDRASLPIWTMLANANFAPSSGQR
jgi:AcrR family transcriptional regulator